MIGNVIVDKDHRGCRIGHRLMAGTLQAAWATGRYKAVLMTGSSDPATHAFYRSCGFSGTDKRGYVSRPIAPARPPGPEHSA